VIKKLLNIYHPFTIVLYLSAMVVAILAAYKLGGHWAAGSQPITAEEYAASTAPKTAVTQLEDNITSAWALPPFALEGTDGEIHSLREWEGKVILLNFWATWCPPCKYEIPEFIEYQNEYGDAGFQIVGIGIDDPDKVKNFTRTLKINYPVLLASSGQMMYDWGNHDQVLPYSVLIDRSGQIRYIHRGQLTPLSFEHEIKPIIEESPTE